MASETEQQRSNDDDLPNGDDLSNNDLSDDDDLSDDLSDDDLSDDNNDDNNDDVSNSGKDNGYENEDDVDVADLCKPHVMEADTGKALTSDEWAEVRKLVNSYRLKIPKTRCTYK